MIQQNLVEKFRQAGLELRFRDTPIGRGSTQDIVQMTVGRKFGANNRRTEWIEIYPGAENNTIQVRSICKKRHQVVLLVMEPAREFEIKEAMWRTSAMNKTEAFKHAKKHANNPRRLLRVERETNGRATVWHSVTLNKTPKNARTFLMGLDERQIFISQTMSPCTTVDEAHASLGNKVVVHEAIRKGSAADRQGEWFFLQTDEAMRDQIENALNKNIVAIQKKIPLGRGGNPHIADERLVMSSPSWKLGDKVFIRGCVRHVDHKTIKFYHWREVVSNNEEGAQTFGGGSNGNYFID